MKKYRLYILAYILLLSMGCTENDESVLLKEKVDGFRELYAKSEYTEIYENCTNRMMVTTTAKEFNSFMKVAKAELGEFKISQLINLNYISYVVGDPDIISTYKSEYYTVYVTEKFTFNKVNNDLKLSGYSYTLNAG
ncbi:hypothetical protein KWG64_12875 [Rahnella sp. PD12R]|uniref:hypothetical protein n=1 Tax=Rahnella sp. PD12R TaxID=2855688 RepID=UPI001C477EF4|nr:hypothetical protein [Rahnella sp. PD12R]MBV6818837.1 hypothetical protein [Rahnella sp. PD12R]